MHLTLSIFLISVISILSCGLSFAQDKLQVGSTSAKAGALVELPIILTDTFGTALGVDSGANNQLQGIAFRVYCEPSNYISAISIKRSGAIASLVPLFEYNQSFANSVGYMVSFSEVSQPIPPLVGEGGQVATLSILLSELAKPLNAILVGFDKNETLLSNQAGTVQELASYGLLQLIDGRIDITKGSSKPVISVRTIQARASEKGQRGKLRISRSGSTKSAFPVRLSISGSADPGKRYRKLPRTLAIAKGRSYIDLQIVPIKDKKRQGAEDVVVSVLANKAYAIMPPGRSTIVISD